jgi:ABC-2 type transport system permease protein
VTKANRAIPFLFQGLPVEYEIVRTINSVSGSHQKKTLGVFATDAPVLGTAGMGIMGFNLGGGTPAWEFFTELNKQYDVQEVTGGELSPEDYDALVVVQPSTLDNEKMDDLVAAIKSGIPTAIFEDPLPLIQGSVTGTYEPRRNNNSGPDQGGSTPEKGDLKKLWDLLQINFNLDPMERLKKFNPHFQN